MAKAGTFKVGDVFHIRKGDKLNIGIPEYCALQNSISPSYVLTKNLITIGSIVKAEKRYNRDTLYLKIVEDINEITGITPTTSNHLNKDVNDLVNAVEKIEKKLTKSFDTSLFIGEWNITKIERSNENGAVAVVYIKKINNDGSVMDNFFRVYGNEKMNFEY
jgi:hypothetical protein